MMVGVNISDEQLGSIADRTIQEADQDGDSAISFTEFVKVSQPPLGLKVKFCTGGKGKNTQMKLGMYVSCCDFITNTRIFFQVLEKVDVEQKMSIRFLH